MTKETPRPRPARRLHRQLPARGRLVQHPARTRNHSRRHLLRFHRILHWSRQLRGEPAFLETAGFQPLFNGKDLTGWEGDSTVWSAKDGEIVGTSKGLKQNQFLATEPSFGDFVLKLTFRMRGSDSSNSGVQFRSVRVPGTEMSGYQADVGQNFWGCLYDESRRNRVLVQASESAVKAVHKDAWNQYVIDAKGDHIRLFLNGAQSVDYHEGDPSIARKGNAALQVHAGGPMMVEFKNIYVQNLPTPKEGTDDSPGFHLRTSKTDGRKYTVYLPEGYDGKTAFPVVLFLHGSGERGSDGIVPAQVGLGPAVLNRPKGFPAVAVFPCRRDDLAGRLRRREGGAGRARRGPPGAYRADPGPRGPHGPLDGGRWDTSPPPTPTSSPLSCRFAAGARPTPPANSPNFLSGPSAATTTAPRPSSTPATWSRRCAPPTARPSSPSTGASATTAGTAPTTTPL